MGLIPPYPLTAGPTNWTFLTFISVMAKPPTIFCIEQFLIYMALTHASPYQNKHVWVILVI